MAITSDSFESPIVWKWRENPGEQATNDVCLINPRQRWPPIRSAFTNRIVVRTRNKSTSARICQTVSSILVLVAKIDNSSMTTAFQDVNTCQFSTLPPEKTSQEKRGKTETAGITKTRQSDGGQLLQLFNFSSLERRPDSIWTGLNNTRLSSRG